MFQYTTTGKIVAEMLSGSSLEGLELLEQGPFQLGDPYTRLDIVGFFDAW
jgi:hypothetical protein